MHNQKGEPESGSFCHRNRVKVCIALGIAGLFTAAGITLGISMWNNETNPTTATAPAPVVIPTTPSPSSDTTLAANEAQTRAGRFRGVSSTASGVISFRGIPYAEPPVGDLRFADTVPLNRTWTETFNATQFSPGCMQGLFLDLPNSTFPSYPTVASEDCLYLNVFTTNATEGANMPVLVWIHGGSYERGTGGSPFYDGQALAESQKVVVVTFNYRLGVLGGLYTKGANVVGNFQMKDQRVALQWVRDNIAAFGGNPSLVTLGGHSAGAYSVATQLASRKSDGLYHRAILASNPYPIQALTIATAEQIGDLVLTSVSCGPGKTAAEELTCLRALPASALVNASSIRLPQNQFVYKNFLLWTPVVGVSDELPMQPQDAFLNGNIGKVPVMTGTASAETESWITAIPEQAYGPLLFVTYQAKAVDVLNLYNIALATPPESTAVTQRNMGDITNHYIFYCPTRKIAAQVASPSRGQPTYVYQFDHRATTNPYNFQLTEPGCVDYVCHTQDMPFVFNPTKHFKSSFGAEYPAVNPPAYTDGENSLVTLMQQSWGNFMRSGNPNSPNPLKNQGSNLTWEAYAAPQTSGGITTTRNNMMLFQVEGTSRVTHNGGTFVETSSAMLDGKLNTNCDTWDTIGYTYS